jgi:metal-dependent HD superfamily phosphatase/phosphodiesterase
MGKGDGGARGEPGPVTLDEVRADKEVGVLILKADQNLERLGYTEHGTRHAGMVAAVAHDILTRLRRPPRQAELAAIAGYLHDVGNGVNRNDHGNVAALIAYRVLERLGMPADEYVEVMCAIGNHEEEHGEPVSDLAAAVILADKSDVHESRVREMDPALYDVHDRVNHAAHRSTLTVDAEARTITLELEIDTEATTVMEYFEIFLERMVMCRRAAESLGCRFGLVVNNTTMY